MAKRTAVIDMGTNSMRMVLYEKTSRFGYYILKEFKSKVRLGEGSFELGGNLTEAAMDRAYSTLEEFVQIAKVYKCTKILTAATSALRDAPNQHLLTTKINNNLNLSIKIIDGKKEAYLGAVAVINLLNITDGVTVDIGGGSCELARIKNGKIEQMISLDLGTIRLKETAPLDDDTKQTDLFLHKQFSRLTKDFTSDTVIAIGGSARTLSKYIQKKNNYPLKILHGYQYDLASNLAYVDEVSTLTREEKAHFFNADRVATIAEGAYIFAALVRHLQAQKVIVSGSGVRDGLYLSDILRTQNSRFPLNYNPSVRSLQDRFSVDTKIDSYNAKIAKELYHTLSDYYRFENNHTRAVTTAAKLLYMGSKLNFYKEDNNGFYFIQNSLNYGFTHQEKTLIAFLIRFRSKPLDQKLFENYRTLLPDLATLQALLHIVGITEAIAKIPHQPITFDLQADKLTIGLAQNYLANEYLSSLSLPFTIEFAGETS
jgi:exopolyphosphatase/guanosine-5'-triphosphate,3'-diphosphate pyrophosphatase